MAQGKFKKSNPAGGVQKKKKNGSAFTRRPNAPVQAKKSKFTENEKIKQAISKSVNKSAEKELRGRAREGIINLSKAQQAVAKHHTQQKSGTSTSSTTDSK